VRLFNPSTVVAILVFFAYALPCMSTAAAMHCDTVTRKWPAIACTCMLVTT
jgi:ferrous iron transport protein B